MWPLLVFHDRLCSTMFRKIVEIPLGTNCAPLIADLFLYCCEFLFMTNLLKDPCKQSIISSFNDNCIYLVDILQCNFKQINPYFLTF